MSGETLESQLIQPTFVQVDQEILRAVVAALEAGLDYATGDAVQHDLSLGRTTRKNRLIWELIDKDIRKIGDALGQVRDLLGWNKV